MPRNSCPTNARKSTLNHRVGRVTVYPRGDHWYLYYYENDRRIRRRVGASLKEARQLAAQVNAQLATGTPALLSFEPISMIELRKRWLDHHEYVLRSSVATIRRYRAATDHLLRFVETVRSVRSVDRFTASLAEEFARYLRRLKISPNGHPNTAKSPLRDKGIVFILETCRTMFNYAVKHRYLPPYHDNPFIHLELGRIPVEDAKPIELLTPEAERAFWSAGDEWQSSIFLTLALTGMRPGELVHLLLPDDVDLTTRVIRVRNKPDLGWRTKTRNERDIPIVPQLQARLAQVIGDRGSGPVFLRRKFLRGSTTPPLAGLSRKELADEIVQRSDRRRSTAPETWTRFEEARIARSVWRDAGAIKEAVLRVEFMKLTAKIGIPQCTCPKLLRHMFATTLQDANVDPLIRQELMGHSPGRNGQGLGMTAVYTHTREATRRMQLENALAGREPVSDRLTGS